MLECARVEVRGGVFGRMIIIQPINESEVQSRHTVSLVDREIGIVGHDPIDGAGQRRRHGMRERSCKLLDQPAVAVAGLEHVRRPGIPPGVEIERDTDVLGPGMLLGEDVGPEQTGLLAIGEESDHVAIRRRTGLECAEGFQDRRDARAIISRPRSARPRIIMGREQQRLLPGRTRAAPSGDDVPHVAPGRGGVRLGTDRAGIARLLDLRLEVPAPSARPGGSGAPALPPRSRAGAARGRSPRRASWPEPTRRRPAERRPATPRAAAGGRARSRTRPSRRRRLPPRAGSAGFWTTHPECGSSRWRPHGS